MKKNILLLLVMLGVASCGPHMYSTNSSGKDDVSYIIVLTDGADFDQVSVVVDGDTFQVDKLYKVKAARKAHPIIIKPGEHQIKVVADGKNVVDENVFIGLQETKKIVLR